MDNLPRGQKRVSKNKALAIWCLEGRELTNKVIRFSKAISKKEKKQVTSTWMTGGQLKQMIGPEDAEIMMPDMTRRKHPQHPQLWQFLYHEAAEVISHERSQARALHADDNLDQAQFQLEDASFDSALVWPEQDPSQSSIPAIEDGEEAPDVETILKRPAGKHQAHESEPKQAKKVQTKVWNILMTSEKNCASAAQLVKRCNESTINKARGELLETIIAKQAELVATAKEMMRNEPDLTPEEPMRELERSMESLRQEVRIAQGLLEGPKQKGRKSKGVEEKIDG